MPTENAYPQRDFTHAELSILNQIVAAIQEIRYGSVVLTVHDGRIVELQKTEKIRV